MGRLASRPTKKLLRGLGLNAGFAQAGDTIAFFPLAALFQDFDALEALQNIPLRTQGAGTS